MLPAQRPVVTEDQYLAAERQSPTKHELVNGVVVAMAGASPRHNAIAVNVTVALAGRLRGRCHVLNSDQRVHVEATGLYAYPDVVVVCGAPRFHPRDEDTLTNPTLLVEVLSPLTEAYDRGAKFAHYRSIPSLMEYVLVSQDEPRVEHYRRLDTGQWLLTEYHGEGALLSVHTPGIEVPLAEIFGGLEAFPPAVPQESQRRGDHAIGS